MVRSDPHGPAEVPCNAEQAGKKNRTSVPIPPRIGSRCIPEFKFLSVGIVAQVDPDFLDVFHCFHGGFGKKVNIRNQGKIEAGLRTSRAIEPVPRPPGRSGGGCGRSRIQHRASSIV